MGQDDIFDAVNKPGMIPGIYNYCDRWCEKCAFTRRCANFEINDELFSGIEGIDLRNKQFWEKFQEVMKVTLEMVREKAVEMGIDMDTIDIEACKKEQQVRDNEAEKFEISSLSKEYIYLIDDWFKSSQDLINEKNHEFELLDKLELTGNDKGSKVEYLNNLVEVIRWYQFQIFIKIMRAVSGRMEYESITDDSFPKDHDGSAKVALIGIDRSLSAWGSLLGIFPEEEDQLYKILIHLEKLRRMTEAEFPAAREFIRPGFDE